MDHQEVPELMLKGRMCVWIWQLVPLSSEMAFQLLPSPSEDPCPWLRAGEMFTSFRALWGKVGFNGRSLKPFLRWGKSISALSAVFNHA